MVTIRPNRLTARHFFSSEIFAPGASVDENQLTEIRSGWRIHGLAYPWAHVCTPWVMTIDHVVKKCISYSMESSVYCVSVLYTTWILLSIAVDATVDTVRSSLFHIELYRRYPGCRRLPLLRQRVGYLGLVKFDARTARYSRSGVFFRMTLTYLQQSNSS